VTGNRAKSLLVSKFYRRQELGGSFAGGKLTLNVSCDKREQGFKTSTEKEFSGFKSGWVESPLICTSCLLPSTFCLLKRHQKQITHNIVAIGSRIDLNQQKPKILDILGNG